MDDVGSGQLGVEDSDNRGFSAATIGDNLEVVELGIGRSPGWIMAAFDHTCVIFADTAAKWCVSLGSLDYSGFK